MQFVKLLAVLIAAVAIATAEKETEQKFRKTDEERTAAGHSSANSPSSCDVVAKYLAAFANNAGHPNSGYTNNYSAAAPNYASQIAALYAVLGALNHAAPSASSYSTHTAYQSPPQSGYSSSSLSGTSGSSSVNSASSNGYVAPSISSVPSTSYVAPAAYHLYSSASKPDLSNSASSSGYVKPAQQSSLISGYSSTSSDAGNKSPAISVVPSSSSSGYAAKSPSIKEAGYRYSALTPSVNFGYRASPARTQTTGFPINFERSDERKLYLPAGPEGFRSFSGDSRSLTYPSTPISIQPVQGSAYNAEYNAPFKTDSYYSMIPRAQTEQPTEPTSQWSSQFRSAGYGSSATVSNKNFEDGVVPVPVCPKNYLFSCQSNIQPVPCANQGYSSSAY